MSIDDATPEEEAAARALAEALERGSAGRSASPEIQEALATAALLRAARPPRHELPRPDLPRPAVRRWAVAGGLAAAAASVLVTWSLQGDDGAARALVETQLQVARGGASLDALERANRRYRSTYLEAPR